MCSPIKSLHIRAVGHWTNKLYEHFLEQEAKVHFKSVNCSSDSKYESISMTNTMKIREQARRTSLGTIMAIRVVKFSNGGYKIHTQRILLNFENWVNGEVSKIGHHFRK